MNAITGVPAMGPHHLFIAVVIPTVIGCAHPRVAPASAPTATSTPVVLELPGTGRARRLQSPYMFQSLEGPFWVARGGYLLFSDVAEENGPDAKIYR